ncbi:MAG TPA: sodium-independent anion transporter, partial [Jiangellaceae bacterium]
LTHIDPSGAEALTELVRSLAAEDVTFVFGRPKSAMRQRLRAAGLTAVVGDNRVYPTVRAAAKAVSTNSPTRAASPARDEEVAAWLLATHFGSGEVGRSRCRPHSKRASRWNPCLLRRRSPADIATRLPCSARWRGCACLGSR